MSTLTPELGLSKAQDTDDDADYLTIALANSLSTLDGTFNSTTGHNHNGAHQGGALVFSVLQTTSINFANGAQINPGASGNQLRFVSTSVSFSGGVSVDGTLAATGATTLGALTATGAATLQSTLGVTGLATLSGGLAVTGSASTTLDVNVTRNLNVTGVSTLTGHVLIGGTWDSGQPLSVSGGIVANTFCYQRGSTTYRCWDNGDFTYSQAQTPNTLVQRDANGNLGDPRIGGQVVIGGSSYTFPNVTGNMGLWRYVKAWSQDLVINLTNGTFIFGTTQYTSGQYTLLNGNSVSVYCDGSNWWVL